MIKKNLAQLLILVLGAVMLPTSSASAAVAFDAANGAGNNLSTITFALTTTGTSRILIVGVVHDLGDTSGGFGITGVTYAGVAMTDAGTTYDSSGRDAELWHLASPATGSNNVVVTKSLADSAGALAMSFTGSDGTVDGYTGGTGSSGSISHDISSAVGDMVVDVIAIEAGSTWTADTGQTARVGKTGNGSVYGYAGSEAGGATVTMSWTRTAGGNDSNAHAVLNINAGEQAEPGGGGSKPRRSIIEE